MYTKIMRLLLGLGGISVSKEGMEQSSLGFSMVN